MDQSKYENLRDQLRQHLYKQNAAMMEVEKYVLNVAERVNKQQDLNRRTCRAGVLRGGTFVSQSLFDRDGPSLHFALQVQFHDRDGNIILDVPVGFVAEVIDDSVKVELEDGRRNWVDRPIQELKQEDAQLALIRILDEEVEATALAFLGIATDASE